ncbi:netrin-G2-like isoform X1 [Branchiostoma floridae]|uniref:Netrin-G2-like isoform X1 n=1 Tax=Branchiostoma floridae TaxID=7739 RepID=A0A9J7LMA1_BRAFL|nr:netrin-G2-like isoform X1 [Branchiostoma floridae]XP_035684374.1 netrin-G2-like isoform X1 [Branchiostoma floridae]XP_035684375.1 netrin-G2-like isoform X1 [Branchiostoma floridae]XP_035684377.1 netrin-G2-like isoform X1 [Branchiostoma floridae]
MGFGTFIASLRASWVGYALVLLLASSQASCVLITQPVPSTDNTQACESIDVNTGLVEYRPCQPNVIDMAKLTVPRVDPANSTCGFPVSQFCTLEIPTSCDICNARMKGQSHPPNFMTDKERGVPTWWQSVSWLDYPNPMQINVTLSWNKTFELTNDIVVKFQSVRPYQMIIEKSMDYGKTWMPMQYYARKCMDSFNKMPVTSSTISRRDIAKVICTQVYSGAMPRPDGSVRLEIEDRFNRYLNSLKNTNDISVALENHQQLRDFVTLTDLRIRLFGTSHPTGLTVGVLPWELLKYYYAISDIQVRGRCKCNLHGSDCFMVNGTMTCDCKHNTEGPDCSRCKKPYDTRKWKAGTWKPLPRGTANECRTCQCNGHSERCRLIQVLGYMVCIGCLHNTMGRNCEQCLPGFYRDVTKKIVDPDVCAPCNCNQVGSRHNKCNATTGECICKSYTKGPKCDSCVKNYYWTDNQGCVPAICNNDTLSCQNNGTCVSYQRCDCLPGFGGKFCERQLKCYTGMCAQSVGGSSSLQSMYSAILTLLVAGVTTFLGMVTDSLPWS